MAHIPNFTAQLTNKESVYAVAKQLGFVQTRGNAGGEGSPRKMLEAIGVGNALVIHLADDLEYAHAGRLREIADHEERHGSRMLADLLRRLALSLELAERMSLAADTD